MAGCKLSQVRWAIFCTIVELALALADTSRQPNALLAAAGIPAPPRGSIIGQILRGDVPEGVIRPRMRWRIERRIFSVCEQGRNRGATLLIRKHAGLRQSTGGALADHR